jgi:hypothetical protein
MAASLRKQRGTPQSKDGRVLNHRGLEHDTGTPSGSMTTIPSTPLDDDGAPDFHALRSRRRGQEAVLYAFDLIEHDGSDLRDLPAADRAQAAARQTARQGQAASNPVQRASDRCRPDGVRACLPYGAGRASSRSGWMRRIVAGYRRRGSRRRTRRARRRAARARRGGANLSAVKDGDDMGICLRCALPPFAAV